MKKHLIIGSPISHSLSPKIHNYWFKENDIDGDYTKNDLKESEVEKTIQKIKTKEIYGMNVTVPFKQTVLPFLETKSEIAEKTNSVNTIFNKNGKIHGDNTDVFGFEQSIIKNKLDLKNKTVLIFGAGGVVPSLICGLRNLNVGQIFVSNRTLENAKKLKQIFNFIKIIEWGKVEDCDLYINSTSVGLRDGEKFDFDFKSLVGDKTFYDVIYNPSKTSFLQEAEKLNYKIINGRDMFIFQAQEAFKLWHNIQPKIDQKLIEYLYND